MLSGIGNSLWLVFTPAGAYIVSPDANDAYRSIGDGGFGLRVGFAEFGGRRARGGANFFAHQRNVIVGGAHGRRRGADGPDHGAGLIADGGADANHARQVLLAIDGVAVAAHDPQRLDESRKFRDGVVGEALHAVTEDALELIFRQPGHHGLAYRRGMRRLDLAEPAGIDAHGVTRLAHGKRDHGIALQLSLIHISEP